MSPYLAQEFLNGRGTSRFFCAKCQFSRRQGDKAPTIDPLNVPALQTVDLTGFWGPPRFRVLDHVSGQCQIIFPVIGASLFIFVPCF